MYTYVGGAFTMEKGTTNETGKLDIDIKLVAAN
jgi:hypothetical protein